MTATIITDEPIIEVLAEMKLRTSGVMAMAEWVKKYRPKCVPEGGFTKVVDLLPHDGTETKKRRCSLCDGHGRSFVHGGADTVKCLACDGQGEVSEAPREVTDNELLCELAGRACYSSFAEQGAKRTNGEYLASMWTGRGVPHRSTGYHAKFTFFIAHVSRRVSHELIRNYVGSDRDEEGSPSQESTRFTHHPGVYICHPRDLMPYLESDANPPPGIERFRRVAEENYRSYLTYIESAVTVFNYNHKAEPKGMDKKRIYEAAAGLLLMSCATSFIWTTNPAAMTKFFLERCDEASDLEMQRFAKKWKRICLDNWPNLFPGVTK